MNTTVKTRFFVRHYEWFANFLLIGGGVLVSASPALSVRWEVFSVFLTGHLIWAACGFFIHKNKQLVSLNLAMCGLDLFAIAIRIF